jgi:nucleoside-diphosphate-sugar epimerase
LAALGLTPTTTLPAGFDPGDSLLLSIPGHARQREVIEQLLAQSVPSPRRAVLASVTGYYGPAVAGPVSEETPPGEDERSASIARTEQLFLAWAGSAGVILRLGGLYYPSRGPFAALARRGQVARPGPPDKIMALIHYDDAAAATMAALTHPAPEPVYLAVTTPCPTRQEFYRLACARLGLPEPDYASPAGRPPLRYDVTRLRRDLLPVPAYPDWRAALEYRPHPRYDEEQGQQ